MLLQLLGFFVVIFEAIVYSDCAYGKLMSYVTSNVPSSKYFVVGKVTLFCTQFLDTFILFHIPKFLFPDITNKYFNDTHFP